MLSASNLQHAAFSALNFDGDVLHMVAKQIGPCSPILGYEQLTKAVGISHTTLECSLRYAHIVAANNYSFLVQGLEWHGRILVTAFWRWKTGWGNEGRSIWQLRKDLWYDARWRLQGDLTEVHVFKQIRTQRTKVSHQEPATSVEAHACEMVDMCVWQAFFALPVTTQVPLLGLTLCQVSWHTFLPARLAGEKAQAALEPIHRHMIQRSSHLSTAVTLCYLPDVD